MTEYYSKEQQDNFVSTFKLRNNTVKTLQNSSIETLKSRSLSKLKNQSKGSQQMLKSRLEDHLSTLKQSIHNLQQHCSKFGGIEFIRSQMDRNQLQKKQYVDYCMSRINKHFQLPVVKKRTMSEKSIKPITNARKSKEKYNKWFIEPTQRFSKSKQATKYEWSKDTFIFNIIKKKQNHTLQNKYLPKFITHSKQKLKRQPLFCKYTIMQQNN